VESIEASGKSVDEAVMQALSRLGKRRDEVEITVLQAPARGAFGIGNKDARVRVSVRPSSLSAVITPEMADAILGPDEVEVLPEEERYAPDEEANQFEEGSEEFLEDEDEYEEDEILEEEEPAPFISASAFTPELSAEAGLADVSATEGEMQEVEVPTREEHILRYMNIPATVQVRSTNPLTLNIHGIHENLGLLIGRRGETLAALQLLVSLIVGHRTKHRMRIVVDAENYRERREENLRSLALRVAQQVRNYRRSIALEAMPPHERRIVHIALSDSKDISTESIGEGDARRVVISLKRLGR